MKKRNQHHEKMILRHLKNDTQTKKNDNDFENATRENHDATENRVKKDFSQMIILNEMINFTN
jgi:hypothetical protein